MGAGYVVGVYGATGHTGGFVVAELQRRGLQPIAIGRDAGKLKELASRADQGIETRVADLHSPSSLNDAFAGASLVINCAGPFLDTAEPIAEAALRASIHYLDVAAEQASASLTLKRFDSPARAKGVIVAPAVGFFGGLGDLLASAISEWKETDEIQIAIALDSWHPTRGTVRTGERNTGHRLVVTHGELQPVEIPPAHSTWTFPEPFGFQVLTEVPLSETILIHRHLRATEVHNFLNEAPLLDLNDPATPPPQPSDQWGRSAQQFIMEVSVRRGFQKRRASAKGRDIYAVTAPLVVEASRRILDSPVGVGGSYAVAEMFDAKSFLQALEPEHLTLDFRTSSSAAV